VDDTRSGFFGRVDVYWPDGPIESYRLVKPSVAIGRSTGNDIVLDTTTVSRYHIALRVEDQQVQIEDLESVNGTYVDGIRLSANSPRVLRGGEEIQVGDVRLIYHSPADITQAVEDQETTQRVTVSQPTTRVELDGPDMAVAPGAHVQATLQIENAGSESEQFEIEIEGIPANWARVDRSEVEVGPGQQAQVVISFKPVRRSDSRPGDYPFVVRVRARSEDKQTLEIPATLHVLPFSGFGMALADERIADNDDLTLYLHNQGSAVLPLVISGVDKAQALRFKWPSVKLKLGPGERRTLVGSVSPRQRRIFGHVREREFALQARSQDPSGFLVSVPGTYVESALLPTWVPLVAVPLIALFTLLILGALWVVLGNDHNTPARPPAILHFGVNTPVTSVDEAVQLTWDVTGSDSLVLVWDAEAGRQAVELDPGTTGYSLTFDQSGIYSLVLEAHHQDLIDTALVTVEVRPVIQALTLEVLGGSVLVRNVQADVRISWSVAGARSFDTGYSIRIEGGNPNQVLVAAPLELVGTRDLPVLVESDVSLWRVMLYVEGRSDLVTSVEQMLPVVAPSCGLAVDFAVARTGPGAAYPELNPPLANTAQGQLILSPTSRDPSGEWLLVPVGVTDGRSGWIRRADVTCTNFDPMRLRVSSGFPPPPIPSPSPTPSLVPSSTPTLQIPGTMAVPPSPSNIITPTPLPVG